MCYGATMIARRATADIPMETPVPQAPAEETQLRAADRGTPSTPVLPARTEVVQLRAKNQLTLPEAIAREVGAAPGDRFRAWVESDGTIVFRKAGTSAYGKYPGLWGATTEEVVAHIREMRDEWEIREQAWDRDWTSKRP